ncbi:MAG: hypothetical protein H6747_02870 [Deltaproteobacteria bacterium]|nr:hypothetical protein [Deltaproteobacteria bacterium]
MAEAGADPRDVRLGAIATVFGSLAGLCVGLWMQPELPPLLEGWGARAAAQGALADAGLQDLAGPLAGAAFLLATVLPTVAALRVARGATTGAPHAAAAARWVLGAAALAALLQLAAPPRWSSDAFLYAYYGKIQAVHGENPYRLPGKAFARTCALPELPHRPATPGRPCRDDAHCPPPSRCLVDPFVPYQAWLEVRAAYGPVALGIFRSLYVEALPPEANVFLLRLLAALAWLGATAWALRRGGLAAGVLVGWLPVGVVAAGNGGHLEPLACLAMLAAWWPIGRRIAATPAALAIGVAAGLLAGLKLPLLVLAAPAGVWLLRRHGRGPTALAAALAVALPALGYALLWTDPHPFGGLADVGDTSIRTPLDLLRRAAQATGGSGDLEVARPALLVLGVVIGLAALRGLWRALQPGDDNAGDDDAGDGDLAVVAAATTTAALAWMAFGSGIFHPWYALPALVAAAFALSAPSARGAVRATLWLAASAPLWVNGAWLALGPTAFAAPWVALPTILLFAPALALWATDLRRSAADDVRTPG